MDRDEKKLAKKGGQYPAILTEQAWSIKDSFNIWLLGTFFLRDTAGSPERARWLHLARSGSQSQRAIWVILPAGGASRRIKESNARSEANQSAQTIVPYNKAGY